MKAIRITSMLAALAILSTPQLCLAQANAAAVSSPILAAHDMEAFLLNAAIVTTKGKTGGVTDARRVTLSDGTLTHDAQVQDVDIEKAIFDVGPKHTELNFKDSYRYNIAGYRLAVLLGLDNVPMSVERKVNGKTAAMTWWIDDITMTEGNRQKSRPEDPHPSRTASYLHIMRVFDELIQNRDRNAGNILWDKNGKLWLIDHTRAFRTGKELLKPEALERCDRVFFTKLRELTQSTLTATMGRNMTKLEIEALLARRDLIVKLLDQKIAQRTEAAVLFSLLPS